MTRRVAVIGGSRIPFARADGPYATCSNQDMLTAALDGLVERYGLEGERAVDEFVAGAVLKHSRDFNLARETVLASRLDPRTPAYDVQQACGTGLQAVVAVANKIALGQTEAGIAGGADTASDVPLGVNDELRRVLLAARRAPTPMARLREVARLRPRHLVPDIPRNAEPRTGLSMGEHAARTAREWGITRQEQDELAAASHRKLATAYDSGFLHDLVTPFNGLARDQNLRPGTSAQKLGALKPVFGVTGSDGAGSDGAGPEATMTAGNSTPLTDGAATVLLADEEWAEARGLRPQAYLTVHETGAVDFTEEHGTPEGLLMAPAYAVPRMLERAGLGIEDFRYVEIHEAFASQVLATLGAWEKQGLAPVDRGRLNVMGSSLATGHPFAATGARIVATLAKLLARHEPDEARATDGTGRAEEPDAAGEAGPTTGTGKPADSGNLAGSGEPAGSGRPAGAAGGSGADGAAEKRGGVRRAGQDAPAPVRGLISVCAAGGQGVTAVLEKA